MLGLSRDMVETRLPVSTGKQTIKEMPRRSALEVLSKIKTEIERLLKRKFIKITRYSKWLANIVPMIKKKG